MKKTVKIISTLMLMIMVLMAIGNVVFATDLSGTITNLGNGTASNTNQLTDLGGKIVGTIQVVGVVIAVIVILVIGIKYMIGSAEEKAEYKKTMIPYLVGAVLIFAGATIVNAVYNIITGLK